MEAAAAEGEGGGCGRRGGAARRLRRAPPPNPTPHPRWTERYVSSSEVCKQRVHVDVSVDSRTGLLTASAAKTAAFPPQRYNLHVF